MLSITAHLFNVTTSAMAYVFIHNLLHSHASRSTVAAFHGSTAVFYVAYGARSFYVKFISISRPVNYFVDADWLTAKVWLCDVMRPRFIRRHIACASSHRLTDGSEVNLDGCLSFSYVK